MVTSQNRPSDTSASSVDESIAVEEEGCVPAMMVSIPDMDDDLDPIGRLFLLDESPVDMLFLLDEGNTSVTLFGGATVGTLSMPHISRPA